MEIKMKKITATCMVTTFLSIAASATAEAGELKSYK